MAILDSTVVNGDISINGNIKASGDIISNADIRIGDNAGNSKAIYFDKNGSNSGSITFWAPGPALVNNMDAHYFRDSSGSRSHSVYCNAKDGYLMPETDNGVQLGDPNNKWNSVYATNVYASSDMRLKENIKAAEIDCSNVIDKLQIKEFNFKSDEEKKVVVGAIAQELKEILPEKYQASLVSGSEDTSYSINEGKLLYIAIGALKEEQAKVKSLEERLERVEKLLEK